MTDIAVKATQTKAVPLDYTIPGAQELLPKAVVADMDGSAAASAWFPCLQVLEPGGSVMFSALQPSVAAGGSANVSWFPGADVDDSSGATFVTESFYLDTRTTGVSTSQVLHSGSSYLVTAQGTYSAWDIVLNVGVPEANAMFPTPGRGVLTTQVGLDPDTLFAYPASHPNTIGNQQTFQVDLGSGFAYHTPVGGPYAVPQTGHVYSYQLTGQGAVATWRVDDSPLSDNYGYILITVQGSGGTIGGGVQSVTSANGTLTVTNSTGPNVDLAVVKTIDGGSA